MCLPLKHVGCWEDQWDNRYEHLQMLYLSTKLINQGCEQSVPDLLSMAETAQPNGETSMEARRSEFKAFRKN